MISVDERIEKLLNRFGQTIENLPKPDRIQYGPYSSTSRRNYYHAARDWTDWDSRMPGMALADYGCHLCDVIDRMEIALETASRWMPCYLCKNASECSKKGMEDLHCVRPCDEKTINDYMLHDQ